MKTLARRFLLHCFRAVASVMEDALDSHRELHERLALERLKQRLQACGSGVRFNGRVFMSEPRACAIGNNVHVGANGDMRTEGGLTIGDNTHISRNFTVDTENPDYHGTALPYDAGAVHKPVLIGRNVWIGMNVSVAPGVRIGEGAIVGLGSVVTSDVEAGAIVSGAPASTREYRDMRHYRELDEARRYGGVRGHVETLPRPAPRPHAHELGAGLFFVLTTGRSGSTSIARTLGAHPSIECRHEPRRQMIRLSTEYAHGIKSRGTVRDELASIFLESATFPKNLICGESDQKYFNLAPILHELLPAARFIWLVRDGREVVASTEARGWFQEGEYNPDAAHDDLKDWRQYRLNGAQCNAVSAGEWSSWSAFAKNCWYWRYVNAVIEAALSNLPRNQWIRITLDSANTNLSVLWNFLEVPSQNIQMKKANLGRTEHKRTAVEKWGNERHRIFDEFCGEGMARWFSDT